MNILTRVFVFVLALLCVRPDGALATCGGGGGGGQGGIGEEPRRIPWRRVASGETLPAGNTVFALYWFPATEAEAQASDLWAARLPGTYAPGCMALYQFSPDDRARRTEFGVNPDSSAVWVVESLTGVDHTAGEEVGETGLADLLLRYQSGVEQRMKSLHTRAMRARSSDTPLAVRLFKQIHAKKCLAPKLGRQAALQLKRLGVRAPAVDGRRGLAPASSDADRLVRAGLKHEIAGDYQSAQKLYASARDLAPHDAMPLRYLGELYRHHTGDWTRARAVFEKILSMDADPISLAVALHGIGKMMIHGGDFDTGRRLIERSIEVYPLALACRNLAVYWNTEGARDAAAGYVARAMALAPEDPYNRVFAATYWVETGKQAEALEVAARYESDLASSYNLAAIWALAGDGGRALSLLRRHFYDYERYDAVRAKEMQEARDDIVFKSLHADPEFRRLTALADGHQMGKSE